MKLEFQPSFDRQFKKLGKSEQKKARASIESLLAYLDQKSPLRPGLGLKNFAEDYWEIRVDIRLRIIFQLTDGLTFWVIGNHEDLRRFIRHR